MTKTLLFRQKILKYYHMKNRLAIILTTCSLLAVSVVLLLVFFFSKNDARPLYCSAGDVEMCVGDKIYNYYQVSNKQATISIELNKENIIDIDEKMIYAKEVGEVEVTLTASYKNEKSVAVFVVKVYDESYHVDIISVKGCYYEGNTLYAQSNTCQFKFEVYDVLNKKLTNQKVEMAVDGNGTVNKNFNTVMLSINENCKISFYFEELEFEFIIYAVLANG